MKQIWLACCAVWFLLAVVAHAADRPNIVHIVADDLGWKDVGFNGATDVRTPNIDALASGGAKLTQFYTQSMCTPTRAALMTGRYPFRYGLQTIVIPGPADYGLDTTEYLLPQCLKDAGYRTAIIGKWHLGHAHMKYWPKQRGFDYQYGAMIGELDYFTHSDAGVLDWFRNNKPVKEKGYTTQLLGADAVDFIHRQAADRPFYLYLAFNAPHTPYQAPQEYIERFADITVPTRRIYAGMIACLDDEIGKVVSALEKKGLRKNTLILLHSDNGGTKNAMFAGQMTDLSKTVLPCDNGPYRDGKGSLFEGGNRVVACANWPGKIKPQAVEGIIHAVDLYPTFAALAGASTAKCKPLDGVNVWETIANGSPSPRTEVVYNVEPFRGALRQGDWKLIWRSLIPTSVDLYNLATDPYEQDNVASAHPERVAAMQDRLNFLGGESAKPLALIYVTRVGLAHGKPLIASEENKDPAPLDAHGPSITDERFGDPDRP
ncbi:arylsulfatase [Roseiconus nitratireducens]|uniref:Arylsulfatase n=1 Tax=Roseiconus nitratireducens TaxID=2605748 RepID=A0A5M6DLG9_9BACT|nr:arylsulfatase [Roseiconus nitratireducens]KAA5547246.1 arylsulfatase [Roseiconus nitratireducens]